MENPMPYLPMQNIHFLGFWDGFFLGLPLQNMIFLWKSPGQVVSEMHRALAEQLAGMDQRMIHIEAHMKFGHAKRLSVTSNASQRPKPSNSAKKLQAATAAREFLCG